MAFKVKFSGHTKTIAVVIAAYNEARSIKSVVQGIPRSLPNIGPVTTIVVDDGSSDATSGEAKEGGATVIRHLINRGQGAALKTGFDYAILSKYDVIVSFDADGQHAASEISMLVSALLDGNHDVVLGSRFLTVQPKNMPFSRKVVLKVGVAYTRLLSRVKVTDTHNGFRAFQAPALKKMKLVQDRMEHASEIIDQIGKLHLDFIEAPVTITYNDYSMQKGQANGNALRIASKMIAHKIMR